MDKYKTFRIRLLDGTVQNIRTKNTALTEGDLIKFIITQNHKERYCIGVVESCYTGNASCVYAKVAMPLTNIAKLESFTPVRSFPYHISKNDVSIKKIDEEFRRRHKCVTEESISIEVGFGFEDETPEILKGYRLFSEENILALLYSASDGVCVAFLDKYEKTGSGIHEIHFKITPELNATEIISSEQLTLVNESVFAPLTLLIATGISNDTFVVLNDELYHALKRGIGTKPDPKECYEDDFDAIEKIFEHRAQDE